MTATMPEQPAASSIRANGRGPGSNGALSDVAASLQRELEARIAGEVRFDAVSRMLYSTDASNYQIEPVGVVIPASSDDVQAAIEIAARHRVPILPRGGGSSLAGQTVGAALVIDFSKKLSRLLDVDVEARTVTVEPGINLDALNRQ
jgi:FAD/FMN-containing dehydrogenase